MQKFQDVLEFIFIFTFVAIAIIALCTAGLLITQGIIEQINREPQACDNFMSVSCLDQRMGECLALEKYTTDQCAVLVANTR